MYLAPPKLESSSPDGWAALMEQITPKIESRSISFKAFITNPIIIIASKYKKVFFMLASPGGCMRPYYN